MSDSAAVAAVLARVRAELGAPAVLIHNAVAGGRASFLDMDPSLLERGFQVNVMALLHLARALAPDMIAAGAGAIIVTGNTSSQRGRAPFAGLAPTKAAQRILCESMARELGPQGVHVAYVVIDAVIDVPWPAKSGTWPTRTAARGAFSMNCGRLGKRGSRTRKIRRAEGD